MTSYRAPVIAAVDETSLGQADVNEFAGACLSIGIGYARIRLSKPNAPHQRPSFDGSVCMRL